jgi:hypothetical protein
MTTRTDAHANTNSDILHPRDILKAVWTWCASLDRTQLIHTFIERPGSKIMWALKLGRFPKTAQDSQRDQNTVAGVLAWLYVVGFLIAIAAS